MSTISESICPYCAGAHASICPRISAIEYRPFGLGVRRVEFFPPPRVIEPETVAPADNYPKLGERRPIPGRPVMPTRDRR